MTEEKEYIYKFVTVLPQEHLNAVLEKLVHTSKGKVKSCEPLIEAALRELTEHHYQTGYDAGYEAGVDAGYTEGYEDAMGWGGI